MRQISCDNQRHRHGGCGHVEIGLSCFVIRMTDVGGGCRRLLGEGEDFCLFSTHLLVVSVTGLSDRR